MRHISMNLAVAAITSLAAASPAVAQTHAGEQEHKVVPLHVGGKLMTADVLSGDPTKAGAPYVIRLHNYDNQVVPPHWHPEDEHVVVIKGRWHFAHGDTFDRSRLQPLEVGDYVMVPKRMNHFAWAEGDTVVQVHGIGPFTINFTDPWTRLTDPGADKVFKFRAEQAVRSARGNGVIKAGFYSAKNNVTQYGVETADGRRFFAFENELTAAP